MPILLAFLAAAALLLICPAAARAQGGVPLWTNRYSFVSGGSSGASGIAVDGNGNVFVTGGSRRTADSASSDYATIKYSNAGIPLWTNRYDGPANGSDEARAIAVDTDGNVIVTGFSTGIGIGPFLYDYATIKYSSSGVPL